MYKNIPAVQNNQVFEVNAEEFYFNDPISLDFQLEFFIDKLLQVTNGSTKVTLFYLTLVILEIIDEFSKVHICHLK